MKVALSLEYNGSRFHGWQTQQVAGRFVQAELEAALSQVANHPVTVVCAGRTDAGVHASCQVIHFETSVKREPRSWILGANSFLPQDISVRAMAEVPDAFHARFSACSRSYRYVIDNGSIRPAIYRDLVSWVIYPLDVLPMQLAAPYLLGEHDFSAYRAVGCQSRSTKRHVTELTVVREGSQIILSITANAFLYHMVRNIAGVLIEIGRGKQSPDWAKVVLDSKDRTKAAITAPASGLYLAKIGYLEPPKWVMI